MLSKTSPNDLKMIPQILQKCFQKPPKMIQKGPQAGGLEKTSVLLANSPPSGPPRLPKRPKKSPTNHEKPSQKQRRKTHRQNIENTSEKAPERSKQGTLLDPFGYPNDPETQNADFHQTLACVCQNTISEGGRGPEYIKKQSSEHFFRTLEKHQKHTPKS